MEKKHVSKLKELVSRSRVGMLGTFEEGAVRFRPMSHVDIDDDGNIWFFTSKDSWKAEDIQHSPTVQLLYLNESDSIYLTIDGIAHVVQDHPPVRQEPAPPLGPQDPLDLVEQEHELEPPEPTGGVEQWPE